MNKTGNSTVKVIMALLLVCVAAFAQNKAFYVPLDSSSVVKSLVPYAKELYGIQVKFLKSVKAHDIVQTVKTMSFVSSDAETVEKLVGFATMMIAMDQINSYRYPAQQAIQKNDQQALKTYSAEVERCKKKHKSKLDEAEKYDKTASAPLYKRLREADSELSNMSKNKSAPKGEFENTEQYNKRLKEEQQAFNESSEDNFLKAIYDVTDYIQKSIDAFSIVLEKYDPDKGIYTVKLNDQTGQFKVSTNEAMQLKDSNPRININPADVYAVGYDLYVAKAEVSCEDKMYVVEFPKNKDMRDIVFRGSELWKGNSAAKNISFTFENAEIELVKMKRMLEEEKRMQEEEILRLAKLEKEEEEERKRQEEEKRMQEEKAEKLRLAKLEEEKKKQLAANSGVFTDERDKKKYKTIKIGSQIWMAENLNYGDGKPSMSKILLGEIDNSRCYENKPENCDKYGRLYKFEMAKTVCPKGFHIPTKAEWDELINFVGGKEIAGKKLKSSDWPRWREVLDNETDEYGFSALPSGFVGGSAYAEYWCKDRKVLYMGTDNAVVIWRDADRDHSVRCVKNN